MLLHSGQRASQSDTQGSNRRKGVPWNQYERRLRQGHLSGWNPYESHVPNAEETDISTPDMTQSHQLHKHLRKTIHYTTVSAARHSIWSRASNIYLTRFTLRVARWKYQRPGTATSHANISWLSFYHIAAELIPPRPDIYQTRSQRTQQTSYSNGVWIYIDRRFTAQLWTIIAVWNSIYY